MLFKDVNSFPVEARLDGGDSAVRAGIIALVNSALEFDITKYEYSPGKLVRHPSQGSWCNPNNFTRDQMMCLIAGLYKQGKHDIIKRVLYSRMRDLFFMQNTERDVVGSKKMKWPHSFYKNSIPNTQTIPQKFNWTKFKFEVDQSKFETGYEIESKWFDSADPLMPNHIWFLIKAAKAYHLYPFAIVGYPIHIISMYFHAKSKTKFEENQAFCESYVVGTLWLFKKLVKNWKEVGAKYWNDRNEIEYQHMLETI